MSKREWYKFMKKNGKITKIIKTDVGRMEYLNYDLLCYVALFKGNKFVDIWFDTLKGH